jgi:hypothetical protein
MEERLGDVEKILDVLLTNRRRARETSACASSGHFCGHRITAPASTAA